MQTEILENGAKYLNIYFLLHFFQGTLNLQDVNNLRSKVQLSKVTKSLFTWGGAPGALRQELFCHIHCIIF